MSINASLELVERKLTETLGKNIEVESSEKIVSNTNIIDDLCTETSSSIEDLECVEWRVWSDERPSSIARVVFVCSDSFLYIKWTRVLVEGKGIATIFWKTICHESSKTVFAKPVSEPMMHIADKIGFDECRFNKSIVSYK